MSPLLIIYVDIDETICHYPKKREYSLAVPIEENIVKVNRLYEKGNTIVYWTARGSTTGLDWYDLTKSQLLDWGAKHHDLKLGKPHFDMYICDKSVNSKSYFLEEH